MRSVIVGVFAIALLCCAQDEKPSGPPMLKVVGLGEDHQTLALCASEPDKASAAFAIENDADFRAVYTLTAWTPASLNEVVAEVSLMPHERRIIHVDVAIGVRSFNLSGRMDGDWSVSVPIKSSVTVDESLLDVEPAAPSVGDSEEAPAPIGGDTAKLVVHNRASIETSVEVELDPALQFVRDPNSFSPPVPETIRARGDAPFMVRIVDKERGARLWYEPAVRLRGHSCKEGVAAPRVSALSRFELHRAESISAGWSHTCALASDGTVLCWGSNKTGQLGRASKSSTDVTKDPTKVVGLSNVTALASGEEHTCALSNGEVHCWGDGSDGQCGPTITGERGTLGPVHVALPRPAKKIFAGVNGTCAIVDDDRTMCWGRIALGAPNGTPTEVTGIGTVSEMTIGYQRACALAADGVLRCWGSWPGDGTAEAMSPTVIGNAIHGIAGTTHMTCGIHAGDAQVPAGSVVCWGKPSAEIDTSSPTILPTTEDGPVRALSGGVGMVCRHGATTICANPFGATTEIAKGPVDTMTNGFSHVCWTSGGRVTCKGGANANTLGTQTADGFVAGFGP